MLTNKNILITGGTGSIGNALVKRCIWENAKRIIVFSRDEFKQYEMQDEFPNIEYVLGDIRDADALYDALYGIDYVVHAAALKQLPTGETNPQEFKKTNVDGAINVINACNARMITKCINIGTDKAIEPVSAYGMSKALGERLFVDANKYKITEFITTRFGNIMGTRGSVVYRFLDYSKKGNPLPVTDIRATRFWLEMEQAVDTIIQTLIHYHGIYAIIPKMPSFKIIDFAKLFDCELKEVGCFHSEKLHEVAISQTEQSDALLTFYTIPKHHYGIYKRYSSDENDQWITEVEMRRKIEDCRANASKHFI